MRTVKKFAQKISFFRLSIGLLVVMTGAFVCTAQEVITNRDVVAMVKSGLPEEIIIAKIQAGGGAFDTSTESLKQLTEDGVPKQVIVIMIAEAAEAQKAQAVAEAADAKALGAFPEQGKLIDLLGKTRVYIVTDDLRARDRIEKQLARNTKFKVVDRVELSEFVIKYESWVERVNVTATVVGNTATARENTQLVGLLTVMMPSTAGEAERLRMVYSVRKSKYFVWEDNPAESTAKQLLKDLQKASALPPK